MPISEEDRRQNEALRKQWIATYYNQSMGEDAARRFVKGGSGGVDDLDNVLYYLLNNFTAADIRRRLKLAAEVHPNEVARAVFGSNDDDEDHEETEPEIVEEAQSPARPSSKLEQARRLLGG